MLRGVTMRIEIEVFVCGCRFSIHANLYAVINHCGYRCPIKGNAVVFFNLLSELYVWVNCIQVIVVLLHILLLETGMTIVHVSVSPPWRMRSEAVEIALSSPSLQLYH